MKKYIKDLLSVAATSGLEQTSKYSGARGEKCRKKNVLVPLRHVSAFLIVTLG